MQLKTLMVLRFVATRLVLTGRLYKDQARERGKHIWSVVIYVGESNMISGQLTCTGVVPTHLAPRAKTFYAS